VDIWPEPLADHEAYAHTVQAKPDTYGSPVGVKDGKTIGMVSILWRKSRSFKAINGKLHS